MKKLIKQKKINEGERSKEKDNMKRRRGKYIWDGRTGEREINNDTLFDVANKLLGLWN